MSKRFFFFVEQSLVDAGFLINEEKLIFVPTQKLEWLGILWDSQLFSKDDKACSIALISLQVEL
jgi:hypothetical protein